ncbi:hypothetical protein [Algoriphagus aquimarinus]|uniref:Uncharacterized protein n=1 Tax=Algoriphagus aquimarinus TaxID=237018 RepID=A0A5C7AZS9_9BACT|nr:hypothetical protein [Algoriphagus aquimarinus]TXE14058.1 hypothetical protein ESV85_00410 [Algoriphagus aquimarinus]
MRNLLILFLSMSLFYSCDDKNDCEGFDVGKEFEIAINETLENCPKNISITLLDIQDSRCPTGAVCIWEGMIVVEAQLKIEGKDIDLQLSTNKNASGFADEFSTSEYTVKLIDAIPYSDLNNPHKTEDKRAILVISKRST